MIHEKAFLMSHSSPPMCLHLVLTDDGICTVCNVDIDSEYFAHDLDEVPTGMGDMVGLANLADEVAHSFIQYQRDNQDPIDPRKFKLRQVGTQWIRLPYMFHWREILSPSYAEAKQLGYRGSFHRWSQLCLDFLDSAIESLVEESSK